MHFQGKSEMRSALIIVGLFAVVGCSTVTGVMFQRDSTVRFKVVDYENNVISNAKVRINTFKKWIPGENFGRTIYMDVYGKSDTNGEAHITFPCKSTMFSYSAGADGFYGCGGGAQFAAVPDGLDLRQTQFETNLVVQLKPIEKPIPMCVLRQIIHHPLKYPNNATSGAWGFDMEKGDWVKPDGKGDIADFIVECSDEHFAKDKALDCALVFTNSVHDGFYMAKCTGTRFRSDYEARTNAAYMKRLDFDSWGKKYKGRYATELLDDDEYVVLRTRTKCDDRGNIVSAHYAKIYGPINLKSGIYSKGMYFNPNENDPNLEADTTVNLMPNGGMGFAP